MANVKIYKSFFYIFDFRSGVTYANDFNRQTHTQTDKPMAIGEILQIRQKMKEFHIF